MEPIKTPLTTNFQFDSYFIVKNNNNLIVKWHNRFVDVFFTSHRHGTTLSGDFVACSLQQNRILRLRVLDRRDRFLDDSFSESGAKVNCVMLSARVPYACLFPVHPCVCTYVCEAQLHMCICAHNDAFARVWVCRRYGCVKCCGMCRVCVFVFCIVWPCVGS